MISIKNLFSYLLVFLTMVSVNQWSSLSIGNTFFNWFLSLVIIGIGLWIKRNYFNPLNKNEYTFVKLYFIWMIIGAIRGMFIAENYWEWKQWVSGCLALTLPLFVYVFYKPWLLKKVLKTWLKYAVPIFLLIFLWLLPKGAYHFYLSPILFLACFFSIIPSKKWRIIFLFLLGLMFVADISARSQVIKVIIAILISLANPFYKYVSPKVVRIAFWLLLFLPIVFLFLGISGQFNIFRDLKENNKNYMAVDNMNKVDGEKIVSDTRTFIYIEVINSAIKNNYVWLGRTPARGNDSVFFGKQMGKELGTGKFERHSNELCFPNIFTWLGVIGMLLYCAIYLKAAYLAMYKSNSVYMKMAALFIAFHFAYGWVEDFNRFDIMNISIWMGIAMGFSAEFRNMTNEEFKLWFISIFSKKNN